MAGKYKTPTIKELIDAGVHFGHQVKRWNPKMAPYIYTTRKNIHVIDLETTETLLKEAADFLFEIASKGGKIVFVGTKKQARDIIQIEARRSGAMHVTERWLGGTVTNFGVIKKNNIDKLIDLKNKREKGELDMYTKKERLLIDREIEKLEKYVGGLTNLRKIPEAIFVVDAKREKTAVNEARVAKIPVVALVDTNSDPSGIKCPIPGNDDAIKSIACIVKCLADAVEQGYKVYADKVKLEELGKEMEEKKEAEKKEAVGNVEKKVEKKTEKKEEKKVEKKKETKKEEKKEQPKKKGKAKKEEKKVEPKKIEKKEEKKEEKKPTKKTETKKEVKKEPAKKRGRPKKVTKEEK
ncbi:30S ribosomal protein S2 [Patescibacteria group bacterium]